MKALLAILAAGIMVFGLLPQDAEAARRLGGARSLGTQRNVTPPTQKATPPQAQQAAPSAQPQPAGNRWLGPLAGLAAGLGLGWLLSQGGFGAAMAAVVMALLAGVIIFALLKIFMRSRGAPAQPMQYASLGRETPPSAPRPEMPVSGLSSPPAAAPAAPANVPAGFDTVAFLKQAKLNFIRLQEANDRRDLNALREVMTEQMFDAILADLSPDQHGHTDVVSLDAELLEVTTEGDKHWASVHFGGMIRDGGEPEPFSETWHLQKPVAGGAGWLLSGIQQTA